MAKRRKKQDPIQQAWNKIPPYLRNRYFLTLLAFLILMVFIDRHDVLTQFNLHSTVNRLENDLEEYDRLTEAAEEEKLDRERNRERFARETYFMQKDDEDVFIIVEQDQDK